jgi:predicted O-methyltransferase YrrM
MLSQVIKAVLPNPVLSHCKEISERWLLKSVPQRPFDTTNLRSRASVGIQYVFSDQEIAAAWNEDDVKIANFYGDQEFVAALNPCERRALYFLIMALKPPDVLEIGTHVGASTIHIAAALRQLDAEGKLTTVDVVNVNHPDQGAWKKVGMSKSPADIALALGLNDRIEFRVRSGLEFMRSTDQRFDLIFLDGNHDAWNVYEEVSAALAVLNCGGCILLHDYLPNGRISPQHDRLTGPHRAVMRIQRENPAIEASPLGTLPWPTQRGVDETSLALVTRNEAVEAGLT